MPGYRRHRGRENDLGQSLFGSSGWLFADLLLAIAMVFLVANTVGVHSMHKPRPRPPHPSATPIPALELSPVKVVLTINPQGLLSNAAAAIAQASAQIVRARGIASRNAGLVLVFTGNSQSDSMAYSLDTKVSDVLSGLGQHSFVFRNTVYRDFLEVGAAPSFVELDIYLFKVKSGPP